MSCGDDMGGRIDPDASGRGSLLSFELMEGVLVTAFILHLRLERGKYPFASDGPWSLILKKDQDTYTGGNKSPGRMPRLPLSNDDLALIETARRWLLLVDADEDRKLIVEAVGAMARRGGRPPWASIRKALGLAITGEGVAGRYGKAMTALCMRINRGGM